MTARLVRRRPLAWAVVAGCAAIVTLLGFAVHDDTHDNAFDIHATNWIQTQFPRPILTIASWATNVPFMIAVLAITVAVAARHRRWDIAALAVLAPLFATALTEKLLKPLVHHASYWVPPGTRPSLTFPSGHETGLASIAVVLWLVLVGARVPIGVKIAGTALLATDVGLGALGLIGRHWHFATDTIGAVCVAIAVTLFVAMAVDRTHAAVAPRQRELVS